MGPDANGWRHISKIGGALLVLIALASACWAGAYAIGTRVGGIASQDYVDARLSAEVEPVDQAVSQLDAQVDSVSDSLSDVESRADSLRRDMRALMWMVCRSDGVPTHRRCGR